MYNQKLWENHNEIKNLLKELGNWGNDNYCNDNFNLYEIPVRKLLRRLNALLDKQRMLIDLTKGNKARTLV